MADVVIENPILNSPYGEPVWHFKFADDGITNEIVEERRLSLYFMPIAKLRKRSKQLEFDTEWTQDRIEENKHVNTLRHRVNIWREGGYAGVTNTTRRLLEYWTDPDREKKLFFCQIEALETAIYILEAAKKYGDAWIENMLREANDSSNPGLNCLAFKMATGTGKTVGLDVTYRSQKERNKRVDELIRNPALLLEKMHNGRIGDFLQVSKARDRRKRMR